MKCIKSSSDKSKVRKEIIVIILQDKDFWRQCKHIIKISELLVQFFFY